MEKSFWSCLTGKGIIIIGVKDGENGENPYRTGGWWVVTNDFIKRLINNKNLLKNVLKKRVLFIEESTYKTIGLKIGKK